MTPATRLRRSLAADRGSATAELVLITPALVILLLFVVALGRFAEARADVDAAARDAARAASLARSPAQAHTAAATAAAATLDEGGVTCRSLDVEVDLAQFRPGGTVAAEVTCAVDLAAVSLLHLPATRDFSSQFVAAVDVYRESP
jgi:Flp pilus assembly protein TadG